LRIVATSTLPTNPKRVPVAEYCSGYAIDPKTPGGRLAARNGWIVTSETKLAKYDAVTFIGRLDQMTSATCVHEDGNLALFEGSRLKAIAFEPKPSAASDPDDLAEFDSLGFAEQIDAHRIRLHWGLPAPPFADVVLRDGISIERIAPKDPACGGAAEVPNVFGEKIADARKKLIAFGWRPQPPPADDPMTGIFEGGDVPEVEACSGTGYGFCAYDYKHRKGFGLRVISVGEEYGVMGWTSYCSGDWKDRLAGPGYYSL
jgi:hypothetical protein